MYHIFENKGRAGTWTWMDWTTWLNCRGQAGCSARGSSRMRVICRDPSLVVVCFELLGELRWASLVRV